jgi:hypothetical protein
MNKSIMRYSPKDKTLCKTIVQRTRRSAGQWSSAPGSTLRLELIGWDTKASLKRFSAPWSSMGFRRTHVTFSGLRQMWKRKEYGRTYSGLQKVKRRRRIKRRDWMIEETKKMELLDAKEGPGTVREFECAVEAKMEIVRRRKVTRRQGQGNQTTINLRNVQLKGMQVWRQQPQANIIVKMPMEGAFEGGSGPEL